MILCLDANIVISLIEKNSTWEPKVTARLATATAAGDTLAVCDLARAECLIGPLDKGDATTLADFQRFFASSVVQMLPVTAAVCERAAEVRVASGMQFKRPDAIHLAAAIVHGCGLFLTNDAKLARCSALTVEVLT